MLSKNKHDLEAAMQECFQFEGVDMLEHGAMVYDTYCELIPQLRGGDVIVDLPDCVYQLFKNLEDRLLPYNTVKQYQTYHDCGKHLCRVVVDGKQKFPNHAIQSARQYLEVWPEDQQVAMLILMDMDFHTLKGEQLMELMNHPLAPTLYFTAWAEIIANCEMFGGQDSTSFKIKKKHLINVAKKWVGSSVGRAAE